MAHLSYIQGPSPPQITYKTIPEQLRDRAEKQPQTEAFVFFSMDGYRESVTYSQVYKESLQFAQVLKSLGIKKDNKVLIYLYNTKEWLVVVFGLMLIGAIPVGTFVIGQDISDLKYVVEKTEAVGIVFTGNAPSLLDGIKRIVDENPSRFRYVISVDKDIEADFLMSYEALTSRKAPFFSAIATPQNHTTIDPDDIAFIMRSSGTTGNAKLIALSHVNLTMGALSGLFQKPDVKLFSNRDFTWLGGSPIIQIIIGGTRVTVSGDQLPIQAQLLLKYTELEGCEYACYTSAVLNTIVEKKLILPSSLHTIMYGGSPIKKKFSELFKNIDCLVCTYGSMEAASISTYLVRRGNDLEDNIGGHPQPGVEIKITGEKNATVPRRLVGKILVRKSNMFLEYIGDTEMTRNAISVSRWYNTGDVGYISEDGILFILGREGDCVTSGSITTHVSEIEAVIEQLFVPQIESVLVVPIPDQMMHEVICACVILKQGHSISADELRKIINERIKEGPYKPEFVVFVDSFPVNRNGKIDRKAIKQLMEKQLVNK